MRQPACRARARIISTCFSASMRASIACGSPNASNPPKSHKSLDAKALGTTRRLERQGACGPRPLPSVGIAHARPAVAHLLIMRYRVVDRALEAEPGDRQAAHGGEQRVRRDHAVVLGGDERDPRIDQLLR